VDSLSVGPTTLPAVCPRPASPGPPTITPCALRVQSEPAVRQNVASIRQNQKGLSRPSHNGGGCRRIYGAAKAVPGRFTSYHSMGWTGTPKPNLSFTASRKGRGVVSCRASSACVRSALAAVKPGVDAASRRLILIADSSVGVTVDTKGSHGREPAAG
jgi:hypothetical protein